MTGTRCITTRPGGWWCCVPAGTHNKKEYRKKMIAELTAARGARLMDRNRPGWFLRTRQGSVNIHSSVDCILGQEYGDYYRGLRTLKIGCIRSVSYGFMAFPFTRRGWEKLNMAWRAEIKARATTPGPADPARVKQALTLVV